MAVSYAGDGGHIDSYYAATANAAPLRRALTGANDTDICIIGAGYSGLSAGLDLAEKGHKVTIVEGARVGWGASGRNGGQIINGLNASLSTIKKRYGQDTAKFVATNVQDGGEIIRQRIAKYDIDCDLRQGNVFAAITDKHMAELEARKSLWAAYGIDNQELLDRETLKTYVNSEFYAGGLVDHSGGHMHPLNLALGEAAAFEKNGGTICEMSPVISVDTASARPLVRTVQGEISCRTLIICGNAYLGNVVEALTSRVMPVSTQVLATEPLGEKLARSLIPGEACIEDVRYILDYYRLSADNRLIFGGGSVYGGSDPVDIEAKLRRNLVKVFPQLAEVKVDYAWSGNFALSFSRMPQIGRLGTNIYFAHGYSGHGVTASHLFGRILSEAVDGDLSRFDVFAGIGWVPFPGGRKLAVPYSVLGSWWYGLRDRLGV
ncbi:MAG TPA: FAD-binding oxidoreductase [Devosia sp.]|nr:FAD-binding oxidoreductase [Devosia sp.]